MSSASKKLDFVSVLGGVWATPDGAYVLLLALHSGVLPGGAQEIIWDVKN